MDYMEEWQFIYRGVDCAIVHHGVNGAYRPKGTWCFYITLRKHRFADKKEADVFFLNVQKSDTAPYESRYAYEYIPLEMHGDITFYDKTTALNRKEGLVDAVKMDYYLLY